MAATRLIAMHLNKGKSLRQCLKDRADYAKNNEKTNEGELVSSYECNPDLIEETFELSKREYFDKTGRKTGGNVIAYQIRQSFKPGEVSAEEANQIGYETAMRWTKGKHAFIVATHIDKKHIHNHIIYNSTNLTAEGKYRDFFRSGLALQKVSDIVCLEHGLSVIKKKKYSDREKYYREKESQPKKRQNEKKLDMLINIQDVIAKEKGPGYEQWAKVYNVKKMASTLVFLKEKGLRDYDELEKKADEVSKQFGEKSEKIKSLDSRLDEIATLKKHIINYSKTKEIYIGYRKSGYSKKYLEEHREEIILHKAAKEAFTKLNGKVPKIKELNEEYNKTLEEKKKTYAEYKKIRQELKDYQTAKNNVDYFLNSKDKEMKEEQKNKDNQTL